MPPPPPIADSFPEDIRKGLADLNFKVGAVFKFYCKRACKEKRFIYIGDKYDRTKIALLHINSEINKNKFPTSKLQAEHLLLQAEGRDFLSHDSYVNCSEFIIRDRNEIYELLKNSPSIHLSHVIPGDLEAIKDGVKKSRVISISDKKEYGLFL